MLLLPPLPHHHQHHHWLKVTLMMPFVDFDRAYAVNAP
jgi:hypothetical protein